MVPVLSVIRCDASSQSLWCKAAAAQDPERTNDQEMNDTRTFSSLISKDESDLYETDSCS